MRVQSLLVIPEERVLVITDFNAAAAILPKS
jgi:hypothetical protein